MCLPLRGSHLRTRTLTRAQVRVYNVRAEAAKSGGFQHDCIDVGGGARRQGHDGVADSPWRSSGNHRQMGVRLVLVARSVPSVVLYTAQCATVHIQLVLCHGADVRPRTLRRATGTRPPFVRRLRCTLPSPFSASFGRTVTEAVTVRPRVPSTVTLGVCPCRRQRLSARPAKIVSTTRALDSMCRRGVGEFPMMVHAYTE